MQVYFHYDNNAKEKSAYFIKGLFTKENKDIYYYYPTKIEDEDVILKIKSEWDSPQEMMEYYNSKTQLLNSKKVDKLEDALLYLGSPVKYFTLSGRKMHKTEFEKKFDSVPKIIS